MFNSLWVAKTGMEAQDFRVATIANNMANSATTGFKKDLAHFTTQGYTQIRGRGGETEGGQVDAGQLMVGQGVRISDTSKVYSQGSIKQTDNETDFMIGGEGYFVLVDEDGEASYTRDGHFEMIEDPDTQNSFNLVHVATNLKLVAVDAETGGGVDTIALTPMLLTPQNNDSNPDGNMGPLTLARNGEVMMQTSDGDIEFSTHQYIPMARFGTKSGLIANPGGVFKDDAARTGGANYFAGTPTGGFGTIRHKALEVSNVTVIDEMVDMIEAQRGYEMGAKVLEKTDEMMSTLIQRT